MGNEQGSAWEPMELQALPAVCDALAATHRPQEEAEPPRQCVPRPEPWNEDGKGWPWTLAFWALACCDVKPRAALEALVPFVFTY